MRLTIDGHPGDPALRAALDAVLPTQDDRDDFAGALEARLRYKLGEDGVNRPTSRDITETLHRLVLVARRLPDHGRSCQGIALRKPELCDCPEGELMRLIDTLDSCI